MKQPLKSGAEEFLFQLNYKENFKMENIITNKRDIDYAMKHLMESKLGCMGEVHLEHRRAGEVLYSGYQGKNTFTTEGMALMHNVLWGATAKITQVYCGLWKGSGIVPALADTAAVKLGAAGTYTECQDADYDSPATNRAEYDIAATTTAVATNAAAKCEFVMACASPITLYGAFLCTAAAKTATTGALICAKLFTTARAVVDNDEISVGYQITFTSS